MHSEWLQYKHCPVCGENSDIHLLGKMEDRYYSFGLNSIAIPAEGISLARCSHCQLVFKQRIPSPAYLSYIFVCEAGNVWDVEYNYAPEVKLVNEYYTNNFDLLDVGPANGDFLKAMNHHTNRCSGLDVVQHPKVSSFIKGEFITGLLDSPTLAWSGKAYDAITAFDVFEHMYDPDQAMNNINMLLKKGGLAFIETGNCDSAWAKQYGIAHWWYVRLFEHHVFWSPTSLTAIAEKHGFTVERMVKKRHKRWHYETFFFIYSSAIRALLWRCSPWLFKKIRAWQGKNPKQPRSPFIKDHFLVVLRKL